MDHILLLMYFSLGFPTGTGVTGIENLKYRNTGFRKHYRYWIMVAWLISSNINVQYSKPAADCVDSDTIGTHTQATWTHLAIYDVIMF